MSFFVLQSSLLLINTNIYGIFNYCKQLAICEDVDVQKRKMPKALSSIDKLRKIKA